MTQRYLEQFDEFIRSGAARAPHAVNTRRRTAIEQFAALGFPTTKNEDWHFTSVSALAERDFTFVGARTGDVSASDLEGLDFGGEHWHTAVFVNGRFAPELSSLAALDAGVRVLSLADAWTQEPDLAALVGGIVSDVEQHAFTALNTAFMADGAVVRVPKEIVVRAPIHLLFVTDAHAAKTVTYPRNLIVVERGARATIVESYVALADATYFTNAVTEVSVADGATLEHFKIQREGRRAYHVGTIEAT